MCWTWYLLLVGHLPTTSSHLLVCCGEEQHLTALGNKIFPTFTCSFSVDSHLDLPRLADVFHHFHHEECHDFGVVFDQEYHPLVGNEDEIKSDLLGGGDEGEAEYSPNILRGQSKCVLLSC